jgi:aspartyl/glutamyl-tRNA(Asn/Gln) amidotransferase C subunit
MCLARFKQINPVGNKGIREKVGYTRQRLEAKMPDEILMEEIDVEVFTHLMELAALELKPEEAEYLRRELNNQLRSIKELQAIPLDKDTLVATHGVPYSPDISPPVREDEWVPEPKPEAILGQAPQVDDGYIIVPEIQHTELE